jgi:hypothetical protein
LSRNFFEAEPLLGSRRKSRIGGVGCIAGRETRPLRQQSEKDGFFLDERARRSWSQKSALQWRHVKVLSPKSTYSHVSLRNYKENER